MRVVGTGHSFTPIAATDGVLISLDALAGLESHDLPKRRATILGGTKLKDVGSLLFAQGLAMENLGDIDVQSIAGAIGTGTHGTGPAYANLSAQVTSMRITDASGEVVSFSPDIDRDLYRAARVSMGMFGVVTAIELSVQPAFRMHERVWRIPFDQVMTELDAHIETNDHFEFFWYPNSDDMAECKALNEVHGDYTKALGDGERLGWSAEIIPSVREFKFNEMEYSVPAQYGPECARLIRQRIAERHPNVRWPIEYRTLRADTAWLSTAYLRDTVTISLHEDARRLYTDFFTDIESIFRDHEGRPHWGKIHTRTRDELRALYPMWDRFAELRHRSDPRGRFLNPYLRTLFS